MRPSANWVPSIFLLLLLLSELLAPRLRPVFDDLFIIHFNEYVQNGDHFKIWSNPYWEGGSKLLPFRDMVVRPMSLSLISLFQTKFYFLRMLALLAHFTLGYLLFEAIRRRMPDRPGLAVFFFALFLFHPAQVEASTQIVGLQETIPAIFGILAIRWMDADFRWKALGALLVALAPGMKETGYIWIAAYCLFSFQRRQFVLAAVSAFATVSWLAHRYWVSGAISAWGRLPDPLVNPLGTMDWHERIPMGLSLIGHHVRVLFAPVSLSSDYSRGTLPDPSTAPLAVAIWALLGVALATLALVAIWRNRSTAEGREAGVAVASILPSLHVFGLTGMIFAERFGHVPRWGIFMLLALAIPRRLAKRAPIFGLAVIVTIISYSLMIQRQREWKDPISLFSADSLRYPANPKLHWALANSYAVEERWEDAKRSFEEAKRLAPGFKIPELPVQR